MQNKQDEEILLHYCSGRLATDRAAEVEIHAKTCAQCARWIANQNAVWNALDDFTAPAVSPEFQARVYQRLEAEPSGSWWKQGFKQEWKQKWFSAWRPALAMVAVAAALAVGVMVRQPQILQPPTKASMETVDMYQVDMDQVNMDQVEHALEDLDLLTPRAGASRL